MDNKIKSFTKYSLAYRLPPKVEEHSIELSKKLANQFETHFVLGKISYVPHVTVYSNEYPEDKIGDIVDTVKRFIGGHKPIEIKYTEGLSERGYVDITIERTNAQYSIHKLAIEKLNPIMGDHIREKYQPENKNFNNYSEKQKKNIKLYKHPDVMSLYRPHITLARLIDESKTKEVYVLIDWPFEKAILNTVALFEMGEHGSCQKEIQEFKLL